MIIKEFLKVRSDGIKLYKIYSDQSMYIQKDETSEKYLIAIDVEDAPYTYTELDQQIPEYLLNRILINKED